MFARTLQHTDVYLLLMFFLLLLNIICHTSSNFSAIRAKALKMTSEAPVMVTIRSVLEPLDILIRAPLCIKKIKKHGQIIDLI